MSAVEHLKRLVEHANHGDLSQFPNFEHFHANLKNLQERFDRLKFEIEHAEEHEGGNITFCYTVHGEANGRRVNWSGSGVGRLSRDSFSIVKISEDYLRRRILLGALDVSTSAENITGTWKGEIFGIDFSLNLKQSKGSSRVTGTIEGLGLSFPVSGTNTPPTVELSGSQGGETIEFKGEWVDENTIKGKLSGAGLNEEVTLKRQ